MAEKFATVGEAVLRTTLASERLNRDVGEAIEHIMSGFQSLHVHADIRRRPQAVAGQSSSGDPEQRLDAAGRVAVHAGRYTRGIWKPARGAYEHAAHVCNASLQQMMLVTVHPWIDGAARAGMATAWINWTGARYPGCFTAAQMTVESVKGLVGRFP